MSRPKQKRPSNIQKYRKPLNLNIGLIIFAAIFIYILICIILFFNQKHIKPHEVKEGSLTNSTAYHGVILREEQIVNCEESGYVNYYAREGERIGLGNLVYTIDEADRLTELLKNGQNPESCSLNDTDLQELRNDIVNFSHNFNPEHFSSVYDFKFSVEGTVLKLANTGLMNLLCDVKNSSQLSGLVSFCNAPESGIVMYWTDGYENLLPEDITEDLITNKKYEKKQLLSNHLLAQGDAVYKLCTSENWSVIIPVEKEWGTQLEEEEYIKVRFQKNQEEAWGKIKLLCNSDDKYYLQISFNISMISFATDRFIDIELLLHDEKGLKIPNSSIVEKEFFLIPEEFLFFNNSQSTASILKEVILEDGTQSTKFIEVNLYSKDEEKDTVFYYVDDTVIQAGDRLYKEDSMDEYVVSRKGTLVGVYNMNKGYADFRRIIILYQNDEYAIVQSNTDYGLNVYDFIVLDANAVEENDFLYE